MTINSQQEYKLPSGQTISIQHNVEQKKWEVACSNPDDSIHWYKEFDNEFEAKKEFLRWK